MEKMRRSIRLRGYDYTREGAYFVTLCVQDRECLFGEVVDDAMVLNDAGRIVAAEWVNTPSIRTEIELDEWAVMPNHFHAIVWIRDVPGRGDRPVAPTIPDPSVHPTGPAPKSLGALAGGFKSAVTSRINQMRKTPRRKVWQRGFFDHIIRNDRELHLIREYIANNPARWDRDRENPARWTRR